MEDAAVLAICLQNLPHDLPKATRLYTKIRFERATQVQQFARAQRLKNHMPDGPAQVERDAAMKEATGLHRAAHRWTWAASEGRPAMEWTQGLYGYDAEEDAKTFLSREIASSGTGESEPRTLVSGTSNL